MLVEVSAETPNRIEPPAGVGFVELMNEQYNSARARRALFARIDDGSAGPWTFTWGGTSVFRWFRAMTYRDHDGIGSLIYGSQVNAASTSIVAPAISPVVTNALLLFIGTQDGAASATWTAPPGMTSFDNIANCIFTAEEQLSRSGSTGSRTGVISAANANVGTLVAITPPTVVPTRPQRLNLLGVG